MFGLASIKSINAWAATQARKKAAAEAKAKKAARVAKSLRAAKQAATNRYLQDNDQ